MESLDHYLDAQKKRGALKPPVFPVNFLVLSLAIHCIALATIDFEKSKSGARQTQNFSITIKQHARSSEKPINEPVFKINDKQVTQKTIVSPRPRPPVSPEEQPPEASPPPARIIYSENELDGPPEIIGELTVDPLGLIPSEIVGLMTIRLLVDESGVVVWSYIEQSDFSKDADQQIVDEFKAARFLPGKKAGKIVKSLIQIEISRRNE